VYGLVDHSARVSNKMNGYLHKKRRRTYSFYNVWDLLINLSRCLYQKAEKWPFQSSNQAATCLTVSTTQK